MRSKMPFVAQRDGLYSWVVAVISLLLMSAGMGATSLVSVALKPMAEELGGGRVVPALCYTLVFVGAGLGGPFMGWVADRTGVWVPAILAAVTIPSGAFIASRRSSGPLELYVAHGLIIGLLGNAALLAPLIANVQRWFDRQRGLAMAVVTAGQGFAGVIWMPVLDSWVTNYGWRQTYFRFAATALLSLGLLSLLLWRAIPTPPAKLPSETCADGGASVTGASAPLGPYRRQPGMDSA